MNRSRIALAAFWLFAGTMHFIRPREYEAIVPEYVPISPRDAVRWSGYAEIAGGLAVLPASTRRLGASPPSASEERHHDPRELLAAVFLQEVSGFGVSAEIRSNRRDR